MEQKPQAQTRAQAAGPEYCPRCDVFYYAEQCPCCRAKQINTDLRKRLMRAGKLLHRAKDVTDGNETVAARKYGRGQGGPA